MKKRYLFKLAVFVAAVNLPFISVDISSMANETENKKITYEDVIEENISNDTTEINKNIEKKLNAYGITDDIIMDLSEEFISKLEENNGDLTVETKYYGIETSDNEEDTNLNDNEYVKETMVELTKDEVDEIINEKYRENDSKSSYNSFGVIDSIYASNECDDEWKYDGGVVELYILITGDRPRPNGARTVYTQAIADWLQSPSKRGEDVLEVCFNSPITVIDESIKAKYLYDNVDHSNPGYISTERITVNPSKVKTGCVGNVFYVKFDLIDDKSYAYARNHRIILSGTGACQQSGMKNVNVNLYYYHKTTKLSYSTGIGFGVASNGLISLNVCETVELKKAVTKCPKEIYAYYEFK